MSTLISTEPYGLLQFGIAIVTPLSLLVDDLSTVQRAKTLHHIFCFVIPHYSLPGGLFMFYETYR